MHAFSHKLTAGILTVLFASLQLLGQWLHALGHDHAHLHLPVSSLAPDEHSHHGCCHHHSACSASRDAAESEDSDGLTPGYRANLPSSHGPCHVCDYLTTTFQKSQSTTLPGVATPVERLRSVDSSRLDSTHERVTQPRAPPSATFSA